MSTGEITKNILILSNIAVLKHNSTGSLRQLLNSWWHCTGALHNQNLEKEPWKDNTSTSFRDYLLK